MDATKSRIEEAIEARRQAAEKAMARYPQYAGHWDHYGLALVLKDITTKGGPAARRGDYVLLRPGGTLGHSRGNINYRLKVSRTIWSPLRDVDVAVWAEDLRVVWEEDYDIVPTIPTNPGCVAYPMSTLCSTHCH